MEIRFSIFGIPRVSRCSVLSVVVIVDILGGPYKKVAQFGEFPARSGGLDGLRHASKDLRLPVALEVIRDHLGWPLDAPQRARPGGPVNSAFGESSYHFHVVVRPDAPSKPIRGKNAVISR